MKFCLSHIALIPIAVLYRRKLSPLTTSPTVRHVIGGTIGLAVILFIFGWYNIIFIIKCTKVEKHAAHTHTHTGGSTARGHPTRYTHTCTHTHTHTSVYLIWYDMRLISSSADFQDFPGLGKGHRSIIWTKFAENCIKMKKIWQGCARFPEIFSFFTGTAESEVWIGNFNVKA